MKTAAALLLLLLPALAPMQLAQAQPATPATPPDPAQRCRDLLSGAGATPAGSVEAAGPSTCEFTDLALGAGATRFHFDRLVLAGFGEGSAFPPERLRAEGHGVRFRPEIGNPTSRWIAQVIGRASTVLLDYEHGADGTLRVNQVAIISPTLGVTMLSATLDSVTDLSAPDSARLRQARLHMDGRGFFESYVVPFAAASLLGGKPDPAAAFAGLQQAALATVRQALSGGAASAASIEALTRFLDALPHPDRALDVFVDLPNPVPMTTLTAPDQLRTALPQGSVVATYDN